MHRSLLPLFLASLGSTLFAWALSLPLFEWQVSEIATNPSYDIHFNSSPWTGKFGDSLEDGSMIFYQFDGSYCENTFDPEELNFVVKRSRSEAILEQITRNINRSFIPWLWLLIFLSGIYMWWYTLHRKRPVTEALILTVAAVILLFIMLEVSRPFFAHVASSACLEGTVTFNANLAKVHYETVIIFFTGILLELGALGIMLHSMVKAIMRKKGIQTNM